ncbi:alpha/beta hydrolase [Lentzea sp. NPDC058450]|uniref:alpha/beta hydrolase n=1 Tax=Lentzea sp. NPDC058450 TaxID=3346505 RepID=UPI003657195A
MTLDAETRRFLDAVESGGPPIHHGSVTQARSAAASITHFHGKGPALKESVDRVVVRDNGQLELRVLTPQDTPRAIVVYYHGGGWVHGSPAEYDHLARRLAAEVKAVVVLARYRLAPEHLFPAAVDDATEAARWVCESRHELTGAPVPIVVAGDSAGGNLAAVVARRARDLGLPVDLQVLVYPVTDADTDRPSYLAAENQLMVSRDTMNWYWDHYVPDLADRLHPDASPLRAEDLRGLAPAIVLLAEHDVLRDEGQAYATALAEAGVPTRVHQMPGQMHGFLNLVNVLPGSAAGIEHLTTEINAWLDQAQPRSDNDDQRA